MTVGMFLAALAFVAAGLLQMEIDVRITYMHYKHTFHYLTCMKYRSLTLLLENPANVPIKQ